MLPLYFERFATLPYLTEPVPARGVASDVLPGIRRLVADNPSPMTYHGTNTYLVQSAEGLLVIDPGPVDDSDHLQAILTATSSAVAKILVTHTHRDHVGAAKALAAATGASLVSFHVSADPGFQPDEGLRHGDRYAGFEIIHTPGHAADHICLARDDGVVFSGDHVMAWCSTVVGPPGGDMAAYIRSLETLIAHDGKLYLPGHGPPLPDPREHVRTLLAKRVIRESEIERALQAKSLSIAEIADKLYAKQNPTLRRAAERNVTSHLFKLENEGRAARDGDLWRMPALTG